MKYLATSLVALALLTTAGVARAQVDVSLNPLGIIFGRPSLAAEFAITDEIGLEPTFNPVFSRLRLGGVRFKGTGLGVGVNGKYYFDPDDAIDGFYGLGYARGTRVKREIDDVEEGDDITVSEFTRTKVSAGVGAGYKLVGDNRFVFDVALGMGYDVINRYSYDEDLYGEDVDFVAAFGALTRLDFFGRLSLGIRLLD